MHAAYLLCKVARIRPLLLLNKQPKAAHICFISKVKENVKEIQKECLDLIVLFPSKLLKNYSRKSTVILPSVALLFTRGH